jgi:hypothetical protein
LAVRVGANTLGSAGSVALRTKLRGQRACGRAQLTRAANQSSH